MRCTFICLILAILEVNSQNLKYDIKPAKDGDGIDVVFNGLALPPDPRCNPNDYHLDPQEHLLQCLAHCFKFGHATGQCSKHGDRQYCNCQGQGDAKYKSNTYIRYMQELKDCEKD